MRLLHVHSGNLYGGVETLMMTLARGADHHSSMQSEFALCFDDRLAGELRAAGAEVHLLGEARTRNPFSVAAARRRLRQLIGERPFDAIVTHMPWAQALFGNAARSRGVPLVFWMHDAASGRHWLEWWARLTRPDLVLCNSQYTASTLKWLYPEARAQVIAPPVATTSAAVTTEEALAIRRELATAGAATVIIQTSRMEAWKGHELHLEALGKLRDQPEWIVWFAGGVQRPAESSYQAKLKRMTVELGIAERVRFLGHRTDIPKLLKAADIYCQPNQGPEPFGIVFIEALAAGLPVVSVDFGGAREIVNQTCGVLVPPGDANALALTLRRLISDAAERRRLGAAGPARARELCEPAIQVGRIERAIATITHATRVTAEIPSRRESLVNGKIEEVRESVSAAPIVSVVIPTFNGAARLPRVLTALAEQDAPGVAFEVIVVDNASTDETGSVIERDPAAAVMASRGIVCRTVHEPRQGLTYARICGVKAARGELVCFLDDDNIPDSDYIANGPPVFRDRVVGLAVSQVRPDWEIEPPASIYRRRHLLAVNDYNGDEPITFTNPIAPTIGAGLWVRREAFLKAVPWQQPHTLIADRLGRGLCGGGDIEIGVLIYRAGYERRYIPQLRLAHRIPAARFESGYMWRLIIGTITGERALHRKYGKGRDRWEVAAAWARLTMAACTIPLFPLMKSDWRREVTFVTADRFARVRGAIAA